MLCRGSVAGGHGHHGSYHISASVLPCRAEVILAGGNSYNGEAVDIWNCGLILFIMLTGRYPFLVSGLPAARRVKGAQQLFDGIRGKEARPAAVRHLLCMARHACLGEHPLGQGLSDRLRCCVWLTLVMP